MTPSQYASYVRQQQNKANQAIRQYNREVDRINRATKAAIENAIRDHNREVDRVNQHNRRVVDNYNRAVRQNNQNAQAAVNKYNQAVRAHNSDVARDRQRRIAALRATSSSRYVEVRHSAINLGERFEAAQHAAGSERYADLLTLGEREAANSAVVAEALLAEEPVEPAGTDDAGVLEYLAGFSEDLCDRWRGALFSLSPQNPDAGRHFCTSAREIFSDILKRSAPNDVVLEADPACDRVPNQPVPSRRAKLKYLLQRKGADSAAMLGFVESNIDDVLQLFRVFNEATHGSAGKHGFARLQAIRQRVEGGIMFLAAVAL